MKIIKTFLEEAIGFFTVVGIVVLLIVVGFTPKEWFEFFKFACLGFWCLILYRAGPIAFCLVLFTIIAGVLFLIL
jgi:hypothetical protein